MTEPRLSVIVPTLNEADAIVPLLDDLAPLRASGNEVIVVDGGSGDATRRLAAARSDRVLDSGRGRAAQMNAGAAAASGDVLWFVHADTRIPDGAAPALCERHAQGGQWGRFDIRLSGRRWPLRIIERMMNLRSCVTGIATGDQGIFVKRALFERVGGFPGIELMEDIALSKTLRRIQRPACLKQQLITSSRRWEERGILQTILLMWRLRLAYFLGADPKKLARLYR